MEVMETSWRGWVGKLAAFCTLRWY